MKNASNNLIVTEDSSQTAGLISYWRLSGAVTLSVLADAWRKQNLDAKLLPKPCADIVALGRAVREQAGKRRLVRPLARQGAWAIVDEAVNTVPGGAVSLQYSTRACVLMTNGMVHIDREDSTQEQYDGLCGALLGTSGPDTLGAYQRHQGSLEPEDISAWLIKLANANSAVTLRDTGGIYFVPRPAVPFWRSVATALESVSAHRVFKIPAMTNSEAVEAITEAVSLEAERAVAAMMAELTSEEPLGEKALKTRAEECSALLKKVEAYEKLLNVTMPRVVQNLEGLAASVAAASLVTVKAA